MQLGEPSLGRWRVCCPLPPLGVIPTGRCEALPRPPSAASVQRQPAMRVARSWLARELKSGHRRWMVGPWDPSMDWIDTLCCSRRSDGARYCGLLSIPPAGCSNVYPAPVAALR